MFASDDQPDCISADSIPASTTPKSSPSPIRMKLDQLRMNKQQTGKAWN